MFLREFGEMFSRDASVVVYWCMMIIDDCFMPSYVGAAGTVVAVGIVVIFVLMFVRV